MLAIILLLLGIAFAKPVSAGEPPTQTTPANGSVVSSSALNWQVPTYALYSSNPYRIQVDDDSSFPSSTTNKDYYTKNTYYSPILNEGNWYWRIKAKDSSGTWSNWSSIWSFTIQSNLSSPTPAPSPTPLATPTTSPSSSSFTISDIPSQINSDQSFTLSVNLSLPTSPNTSFYLKGAFKKSNSSNYFGLTKVNSSWVKNGSSYSDQLKITTDSSGSWSANIETKPNSEDSGFTGTDDYVFKVGRYTSTGSGPIWSNEAEIKIISTEIEEQGGVSTPDTPSSTTNPSFSSQSNPKKNISLSQTSSKVNYNVASIAGTTTAASSAASSVEVKNQKQINRGTIPLRGINYFFWLGIIFVFAGIGSLGYIYLRRNGTVFNKFRKRN